jgi:hypothetical protein
MSNGGDRLNGLKLQLRKDETPGVQNAPARVETTPESGPVRRFRYIVKNKGGSASGPLSVKLYTTDPLAFYHHSADEPNYTYGCILPTRIFR